MNTLTYCFTGYLFESQSFLFWTDKRNSYCKCFYSLVGTVFFHVLFISCVLLQIHKVFKKNRASLVVENRDGSLNACESFKEKKNDVEQVDANDTTVSAEVNKLDSLMTDDAIELSHQSDTGRVPMSQTQSDFSSVLPVHRIWMFTMEKSEDSNGTEQSVEIPDDINKKELFMNISQDGTSKEGSCLYEDSMDMSTNETGLDPERKMKMQMLKNDLSEPPVHLNDDNRANQTQEGVQIPIEIEHVQTRKISNGKVKDCIGFFESRHSVNQSISSDDN
jgi:hypothetical protein